MTQYSDSFQVPEISRVAPSPTGPGLLYGLSVLHTMRSQRYRIILPHHPNDESGQNFARFPDLVVSTIFQRTVQLDPGEDDLHKIACAFLKKGDQQPTEFCSRRRPHCCDSTVPRHCCSPNNHLTGPKKNPTTKGLHAIDQCC